MHAAGLMAQSPDVLRSSAGTKSPVGVCPDSDLMIANLKDWGNSHVENIPVSGSQEIVPLQGEAVCESYIGCTRLS